MRKPGWGRPGQGSTVGVNPPPEKKPRGRTILLVEDDPFALETLASLLEAEGFIAIPLKNGQEALTYLHEAAAPDVVVLDLLMPVMSGWEFCRLLQGEPRLAVIPLVVVSADEEELGEEVLSLPIAGYLRKPIVLAELVRIIRGC